MMFVCVCIFFNFPINELFFFRLLFGVVVCVYFFFQNRHVCVYCFQAHLHFGMDGISAKHTVTLGVMHASNGKSNIMKKLYTTGECFFGMVGGDHELIELKGDFVPHLEEAITRPIISESGKTKIVWNPKFCHWAFDRSCFAASTAFLSTGSPSCIGHDVCVSFCLKLFFSRVGFVCVCFCCCSVFIRLASDTIWRIGCFILCQVSVGNGFGR